MNYQGYQNCYLYALNKTHINLKTKWYMAREHYLIDRSI